MKKRKVFFYKNSVVYPFVEHTLKKDKIFITNSTIVDILYFIENNGLSAMILFMSNTCFMYLFNWEIVLYNSVKWFK